MPSIDFIRQIQKNDRKTFFKDFENAQKLKNQDFSSEISYASSNGKTKGALEPNEFWYFWRQFLPEDVYMHNSEELFDLVDVDAMKKELYGIANVFERPMAFKGMMCNYNIDFLEKVFPRCLFIHVYRNEEKKVNHATPPQAFVWKRGNSRF